MINLGEFSYWEEYGKTSNAIVSDEFNSLDLWYDYSETGNVFNEAGVVSTNMQINIGDTWKEISAMKINIGDTWKEVASAKINIGDTWKDIF